MTKNQNKLDKRNQTDLLSVLKTPPGRRLLWRILQAAQVEQHGFVPADAYATAFHCGQKSVGLFLLREILDAAPAAYVQMRGEYLSELISEQNEINKQNEENMHV